METIIKFFHLKNSEASEITNFNSIGIIFLPRVGENVFLKEKNIHYVVSEIQHVFENSSDYETKHIINIHLK